MEELVSYNRKPPLISAEDKNKRFVYKIIYIAKLTNNRSTTQFFVHWNF